MTVYLMHDAAGAGGVERVVADLAVGFADAGVAVEVLHTWGEPGDASSLSPGWAGRLNALGQRLTSRSPIRRVVARSALARRLLARRLRARVADHPDNAVVAMDLAAGQVVAEARFTAAPTVVQFHNSFRMLAGGPGLAQLAAASRHVSATLMLTEQDWVLLQRELPDARGGHMRNPTRAAVDVVAPQSSRPPLVIALGRFEPVKNFELLLRAWQPVAERLPSWRLELYGAGSQEDALRSLTTELGLDGSVSISGWVEDTRELFARASVLAVPSLVEGVPLVILEAFAQGVAVVATDSSPGVAHLLDSGRGVLVDRHDVADLAEGLLSVLTDEVLRSRATELAREHVRGHALPSVVEDWRTLLRGLGWSDATSG